MTLALLVFAAFIAPDTGLRYAVGYEVVSPWPAPCADAALCWLAWDPVPRTTRYEIAQDGVVCATINESRGVYGGTAPPRTVLWPAPGWCAPDTTALLQVRACNEHGCGPWSDGVEWQAVAFRCYDAHGAVPCRGGGGQ